MCPFRLCERFLGTKSSIYIYHGDSLPVSLACAVVYWAEGD